MKISLYNFVSFDAGHTNEHLSPEQMQKLDAQLAFNEWLFFDYSGGCELFAITEESGKHLPAAEIESRLAEVIPHFTTNFRAQEELQMQPAIIRLLKSVAGLQVDSSGRVLLEAVREAFEKTTEEGYSGPVLHYLFQKGIWLHEKIRMESSWYKFAVQPAAVVRELAGKIFGTVKNKYVHFIGWHEDFELIVDELAAAGVQDFTLHCAKPQLVNRKIRQSNTPPSKINGKLETADLIFIGDVDAEFQLQKNAIARRMAARNNARLLLCNYSSDVKIIEHVKKLYNVFSYEKSELLHLIKHNNNSRQAILPEINQWFEHETQEFLRWLESDKRYNFAGMIGASKEMQRIFELISRVARTTITILIDGESGTGKEL
ncbi:sigma 54-interacting transcriptional regulator, partial [candidate division KSB1 bacterium]|nr:sigma 54-interacting transcriptional regulator [candidate division KSB1 bacterium]